MHWRIYKERLVLQHWRYINSNVWRHFAFLLDIAGKKNSVYSPIDLHLEERVIFKIVYYVLRKLPIPWSRPFFVLLSHVFAHFVKVRHNSFVPLLLGMPADISHRLTTSDFRREKIILIFSIFKGNSAVTVWQAISKRQTPHKAINAITSKIRSQGKVYSNQANTSRDSVPGPNFHKRLDT